MNFLHWLQGTPFSDWVRASDYGFYICLTGHAIGMAVIVGVTCVLTFRLWGGGADEPVVAFEKLIPYAWAGFVLNAVTGAMLFAADGERLVNNWPFLLKITLIAVGGVLIWALWRAIRADAALEQPGQAASVRTKTLAAITSATWLVAVVAGRLIGYI